jgi:uncharacterized LabA/DUF88 family protein
MEKAVLLIDAENFSYKHVNELFTHLEKKEFNLTLKLAFADWSQSSLNTRDWKQTLNKLSIRTHHLFNFSSGKNASDIQLVIYAMELLYTDPDIDTFILATSDGDFTPLVLNLKEKGKKVIGFGNAVSSQTLSDSCDEYYMLKLNKLKDIAPEINNSDSSEHSDSNSNPDYTKIHNILFSIWEQCLHDEMGWVNFNHINKVAKRAYPSFTHKDHGYDSIKDMIEDQDTFEMYKTDNLNHTDYYFRPRKKLKDKLIKFLDSVYFRNLEQYVDENWLHVDFCCDKEFDLKSYKYNDFLSALQESYLYDVRVTEEGTYFRRKMTKDHRHILLLFLKSLFSKEIEKEKNDYYKLQDIQNYIIDNFESDFSIKKYNLGSLIKTLQSIYPLDIILNEDGAHKQYLIKPKYII